jgi:hypothetical protein
LGTHPNLHVLDKYANLDRARSSLLVQARTQHISLNKHLFRRNGTFAAALPLYAVLREKTLSGDDLRENDLTEL